MTCFDDANVLRFLQDHAFCYVHRCLHSDGLLSRSQYQFFFCLDIWADRKGRICCCGKFVLSRLKLYYDAFQLIVCIYKNTSKLINAYVSNFALSALSAFSLVWRYESVSWLVIAWCVNDKTFYFSVMSLATRLGVIIDGLFPSCFSISLSCNPG